MTSLYNFNYLQHLCQKFGLIPSKKYGQNFLINEEPIAAMLEVGDIKKDDIVMEVGPGFGVLTLALAERAKKVIAFEIEKKLTTYWSNIIGHPEQSEGSLSANERDSSVKPQNDKYKNIEIIWGNVLKQSINLEKYKVIANVPYQITSNIIRKFLEAENKPSVMVLMVQKEVAERICAEPGDMSVLAVSVQCYAEPEIVMNVPKSYFWPVPAVDSAIIKIKNIKSDKASEEFFKIVKAGFANRRKMLIRNLESVVGKQNKSKLKIVFGELGINEKVRAQELSIEQWQGLTRQIESMW